MTTPNKIKYLHYVIQPLITVAFLIIGSFLYSKIVGPVAININNGNDRTFTVDGIGRVEVRPDTYFADITVNEVGDTQAEATALGNAKQASIAALLSRLGISKEDIKTTNYNVYENYRSDPVTLLPPDRLPAPNGYVITIMTEVKSKDKTKIEQVIEEVSKQNVSVSSVRSGVVDTRSAQDDAREKAILDAKRKAESYANAGEFKLGKIASIQEGSNMGVAQPIPLMERAAPDTTVSSPPQINPGTQEVSASVSVTYYIN